MRQASATLTIATRGAGLHEFTAEATRWVAAQDMAVGLLTLFCRPTSASLIIQENAAPAVKRDLQRWVAEIAPESEAYEHDDEGPDDMPAHLRTAMTGVNLAVPLAGGLLALGTWQGLYLWEHRARAHRREVVLHLIGE